MMQLVGRFHNAHEFTRKTMSLLQANAAITEAEILSQENDALKGRLARLSKASISISQIVDTEAALQEVVNSV